jgi:hypothetical protein
MLITLVRTKSRPQRSRYITGKCTADLESWERFGME